MVYFRLRRSMRSGFDLWVSPGGMAVWAGGGGLVGCGTQAVVAGKKLNVRVVSQFEFRDWEADL